MFTPLVTGCTYGEPARGVTGCTENPREARRVRAPAGCEHPPGASTRRVRYINKNPNSKSSKLPLGYSSKSFKITEIFGLWRTTPVTQTHVPERHPSKVAFSVLLYVQSSPLGTARPHPPTMLAPRYSSPPSPYNAGARALEPAAAAPHPPRLEYSSIYAKRGRM